MPAHRPSAHRALAFAVAFLGVAAGAQAQQPGVKRDTPRLTPVPSGNAAIPAGPDLGTPATREGADLGTPVLPSNAAERDAIRSQSAAARAAARNRRPADVASAPGVGCPTVVNPAAASSVAARGTSVRPSPATASARGTPAPVAGARAGATTAIDCP